MSNRIIALGVANVVIKLDGANSSIESNLSELVGVGQACGIETFILALAQSNMIDNLPKFAEAVRMTIRSYE